VPPYKQILAVDDEEQILKFIVTVLERAGYSVSSTSDPQMGLVLVQEGIFDLVITDRQMPGMRGEELAMRVREFDPTLPVLMITGTGHQMNAAGICLLGVDAVLGKPVTRTELLDTVQQLLRSTPA